jgi:serine/threonine protein kinase
MENSPQPNSTISHYRIISSLGAGGMGEVFLAEDTKLDRKVAIRVLPPESVADKHSKKRLLKEARAIAKVDHPNICAIYEVSEENDKSFIVMQYVEGQNLSARIKSRPLLLKETLDVATQVANALAEAHGRGVIHRDIKPQNIILTEHGQVTVLDFGLARVTSEKTIQGSHAENDSLSAQAGGVVGPVAYMSPEQVRGEELDVRSDIFSYGALIYEILNGRPPFFAKSSEETMLAILTRDPQPLLGIVTSRFERLLRRCLDKNSTRRFQTMDELVVALEQVMQEYDYDSGHMDTRIRDRDASSGKSTTTQRRGIWLRLLQCVTRFLRR